ncbi:unnamed protein product [Effrenium voratum]|uniref:Uncharacterized protein n=1 Tax=Effrenium voratum TaxID=2562239 RepID=A0AA36IFT8_9DINO|nr:unnamed protein product [Effrenium voratum]
MDVRVVLDSLNWNTHEAEAKRQEYALSGLEMPVQLLWFRVRQRLPDDESTCIMPSWPTRAMRAC